jgi:Zn-finger nucleic acid-binding protein
MTILSKDALADKINRLRERNIQMIDPYVNAMHKSAFKCLKEDCSHVWRTGFLNVDLKGSGCPKCAGYFVDSDERIKVLLDSGFELLEPYKGSDKKHAVRCLADGYIWHTKFKSLWARRRCPSCSGKLIDLNKRASELRDRGIELLEPYKSASSKHLFGCLENGCGYRWAVVYSNVYHKGYGCPKCNGKVLDEDHRLRAEAYRMLRVRMNNIIVRGKAPSKIYRTEGVYNAVYDELFPYWVEQYKLLPKKPATDDVWQLDHLIPLSWFDPTCIKELKLCWNHKNMRWLTKRENNVKGANIRDVDLLHFTQWHYDAVSQASYSKSIPITA